MDALNTILRFFSTYGYFFLFLATALENIPVIGIFLPGEVIVVAAGFFAAGGEFNLAAVIAVACLGAFTGTVASYALGFWGGRRLIEAMAQKLGVDGDRLAAADTYFSTHGHLTVFVGRYMTGIKAFVPALAGAHKMERARFVVFAGLGIVTWTALAGVLGYFFGSNWSLLVRIIKTVGWAVLLVVSVLAAALIYRAKQRQATKGPS